MIKHWTHLIAMTILLVGAFVAALLWFRQGTFAGLLLLAAVLVVGLNRDTYLPFLGEAVVPCSLLRDQVPEHADTEVTVGELEPGAKVLFWAAEPATEGLAKIKDWQRAYLNFANAGVATVDEAGRATLRVRKPQTYTVPVMGALAAHVHWRVCADGGFMGPVQTTPVGL